MWHRLAVVAIVAASVSFVALDVPAQELGAPAATYKVEYEEKNLFGEYASAGAKGVPKTKEADALLDKFAKHFVYSLTAGDAGPAQRDGFISQFEKEVAGRVLDKEGNIKKESKEFINRFAPLLTKRLKDLEMPEAKKSEITILYGAQMLPLAAKLKHESIGDYLTEIVKDDARSPVLHMFAARGLKSFFPTRHYQPDVFADAEIPKKQRDLDHVEVLCQRIEGKWPLAKMDVKAIQYVRREMIASLAEAQMPAIATFKGVPKKGGFGVAEGVPATTLLKVLAGQLDPAPDLFEKYHAALGVCMLKCVEEPLYQPEAGVYLVGEFLAEFSDAYSKELVEISGGGDKKSAKPASLPWKSYAESLKAGLDKMDERTKGSSANAGAKLLVSRAAPIFADISTYSNVTEASRQLRKDVQTLKPKTPDFELFKEVKGPTIKLR